MASHEAGPQRYKVQAFLGLDVDYQNLSKAEFPPIETLPALAAWNSGNEVTKTALRRIVAPADPWRALDVVTFARHGDPHVLAIRSEVLRRGLRLQMRSVQEDARAAGSVIPIKEIDEAVGQELPYLDRKGRLTRGRNPLRAFGISTQYVHFGGLASDLIAGVPTEFEGPGLYAINHCDAQGQYEFRQENLTPGDEAMLVTTRYVGRTLKLLNDTRMTCMGDDLTTYSGDFERDEFSYRERLQFAVDQLRFLTQQGLLDRMDIIGSDVVVYSEAGLRQGLYEVDGGDAAWALAHHLQGHVVTASGDHSNPNAVDKVLNLNYKTIDALNLPRINADGQNETPVEHLKSIQSGVPLFYNSGKASCPLADASRYASRQDGKIMKFVVIEKRHTLQQHQVAALVYAARGDKHEAYHNVFIDPEKDHYGIAYGIVALLNRAVEEYQAQLPVDVPAQLPKLGSRQKIAMGLHRDAIKSVRSPSYS